MSSEFFTDNPKAWMAAQDGSGQWWAFEGGPAVYHVGTGRWIPRLGCQPRNLGLQKKSSEPQSTAFFNPDHEAACRKAADEWARESNGRAAGGSRGIVMSGEGIGGFGGDGR